MNNTALKILAGILLIGSLVVAFIGIRLSSAPPAPTQTVVVQAPPSIPTEPIVVAARTLKKGQAITADDVVIKNQANAPTNAFHATSEITGRVLVEKLDAGTVIMPSMLAADTMASLLNTGERAMAVQVDEVVGIGGYAKPGDRVDVLLYIPANRETNEQSSAQIILQNARLLSLGEINQMATEAARREADKSGSSIGTTSEARERGQQPRSAVLAIPEADSTRLMLAASSGQLRLALRPQIVAGSDAIVSVSAKASDAAPPGRHALTISDIAPNGRKPSSANAASAPAGDGIIIQEGSKERRLVKNDISPQQP
jgi:pilus assembly protein CpaB